MNKKNFLLFFLKYGSSRPRIKLLRNFNGQVFFQFFGGLERMRRSRRDRLPASPRSAGRGKKFVRAIFNIHRQSGFGKESFASRLAAARRSAANLYSFLAEKENC